MSQLTSQTVNQLTTDHFTSALQTSNGRRGAKGSSAAAWKGQEIVESTCEESAIFLDIDSDG